MNLLYHDRALGTVEKGFDYPEAGQCVFEKMSCFKNENLEGLVEKELNDVMRVKDEFAGENFNKDFGYAMEDAVNFLTDKSFVFLNEDLMKAHLYDNKNRKSLEDLNFNKQIQYKEKMKKRKKNRRKKKETSFQIIFYLGKIIFINPALETKFIYIR